MKKKNEYSQVECEDIGNPDTKMFMIMSEDGRVFDGGKFVDKTKYGMDGTFACIFLPDEAKWVDPISKLYIGITTNKEAADGFVNVMCEMNPGEGFAVVRVGDGSNAATGSIDTKNNLIISQGKEPLDIPKEVVEKMLEFTKKHKEKLMLQAMKDTMKERSN